MDTVPETYRTNVATILVEKYRDEKRLVSDWIDVKEYIASLNYGQLMTPRMHPRLKRIKQEQEELSKRLVAPGRFMVSPFFHFVFQVIQYHKQFCGSRNS